MFVNCLTYALDIEDKKRSCLDLMLWYSRNPENEIREKATFCNRSIRSLKSSNDSLEKDEWVIAFYGFIPFHYNYEGIPDDWDYHFMKLEGKQWMHRSAIGEPITPVTEEVLKEFVDAGYSPQFFAVRKMEA